MFKRYKNVHVRVLFMYCSCSVLLIHFAACVVLVLGEEGEDKYLVAYVVPKNIYVTKKEIRAALKKRLPFYMIPSYFSLLSA